MRADDHITFNYQIYITREAQPDYSWRYTLRYEGQQRVVASEILTSSLKKSSQRGKSRTGTSVLANILDKP